MSRIRNQAINGLKVGDTFSLSRTFSDQEVRAFADLSRDYNPVHFDERFARVRFESCICHGLLVASLLTEIGGQIGWLGSGMSYAFKKPIYVGDTITCEFTITEIDERDRATASVRFRNQHDITVIEATLTGVLPNDEERRVMAIMVAEGDPTNKHKSGYSPKK